MINNNLLIFNSVDAALNLFAVCSLENDVALILFVLVYYKITL